jgi:DNA gyrase subunit A
MSPLEDSFSCNFNVLVGGSPRVMGVGELITEWSAFRQECVRRRVFHELAKKKERLHLLQGLEKILMDIDKAIKIVRETDEEREVIPNLMIGFGIDEPQAEYVAEIRLRQLNREYILKRTADIAELKSDIADLSDILANPRRVITIIRDELKNIAKKYGQPRKTMLYYPTDEDSAEPENDVPDYPCTVFFTREGYFKKITPQSLRMSGEHKLKEGDAITETVETSNAAQLLFFTDRCQVYKADAADFADTKTSVMGDYIPAKLGMEDGESAVYMAVTKDYAGYMLFFFENGKCAKVDLDGYQTKTKRKKLLAAYSDKSPLVAVWQIMEDGEFLLKATNERSLIAHTGMIHSKSTKNTQGVQAMDLKGKTSLAAAVPFTEDLLANSHRFRVKTLPAAGMFPREEDKGEQLSF